MANQSYIATWSEHGGGYAEAHTLAKLRTIVMGRAYAPTWSNVYVYETQCKQEST